MAPYMPIRLCTQGTVSRRRLFLSLAGATIGLVRGRIRSERAGFDPVLALGTVADHDDSSCRLRTTEPRTDWPHGEKSNGCAETESHCFRDLQCGRTGLDRQPAQSLNTTSGSRVGYGASR